MYHASKESHSPTPSERISQVSRIDNTWEKSGLLDGPNAERAAYAAQPFMDVAVERHDFADKDASGEADVATTLLVDYAEQRARRAATGEDSSLTSDEKRVLDATQADLRAKQASESAEQANDAYDYRGGSKDDVSSAFTNYAQERLRHIIETTDDVEQKRKYQSIERSLKDRSELASEDNDEYRNVLRKKLVSDDAYIGALDGLRASGEVPNIFKADLVQDIRKCNQSADLDEYLASSYRMFDSQKSRPTTSSAETDVAPAPTESAKMPRGLDVDEVAAAREVVANMNRKVTPPDQDKNRATVPEDPAERQRFVNAYFADPEHVMLTEQNIGMLGDVIAAYARSMADKMRALQKERNNPGLRYPGTAHTLWFSPDPQGGPPKGGKDLLLFNYVKDKLRQPGLTYALIADELPVDKIAMMMGVDLHAEVLGYDDVFSTPPKKQEYAPVNKILDQY